MSIAERASAPGPARPAGRGRGPLTPEADVGALAQVTPARRDAFARLGVTTVEDLLRLAPRRHEDRRRPTPCAQVRPGPGLLVVGRVVSSRARRLRGGLSLLEAEVEDESGRLDVRWFLRGFLPRALPTGARYAFYGPVRARGHGVEMLAPERERLDEDGAQGAGSAGLTPVHPLTRGLSAAFVRRAVRAALAVAAAVPDPLPPSVRRAARLPALAQALSELHFPPDEQASETARRRLAFDELLLHELALAARRRAREAALALPIPFPERVHRRIRARLPFAPTPAQERAIAEIVSDLGRCRPMHRLLQGDVGSGKTLVAAYALLGAVAEGLQGVLLAPTEVLARQHEATLARLLDGSRVRLARLDRSVTGRARAAARAALEAGELDVVVGTQAVLSEGVRFRRLALVVVDEQHKLGVRQRHALVEKGLGPAGERPHCLVMTATPIPRTLALTVYGDLDLSVIDALPPGRRPVTTRVVVPADGPQVLADVRAALARGEQAFVVYPLVEGDGTGAVRDAVAGRERWARALRGRRVGLLHGQLAAAEKARVLDAFRRRELDLLVATVVVEVGVDVPNASLLVVEHAERFGLTQLHQLRGRVGRGAAASLCVLMDRSQGESSARLAVLAATSDGFRVAEEDLALRGLGDLLGTRQHGSPGFRAARLPRDLPVLHAARAAAAALLASDPDLRGGEQRLLSARLAARQDASGRALGGG